MQNGIKKVGASEVLNFSDIHPNGLKKVSQAFKRNGLEVLDLAANNRKINRNGMQTKKAVFVLAGGQVVELRINDTGDIYQVALNNKVSPFKEHKKIAYLIKDISNFVKKNQSAFDKSLLKKITAATRKEAKQTQSGLSSTAGERVEKAKDLLTQLKERVEGLRKLVSTLQDDVSQLEADIEAETTKATVNRETITQLKKQREELTNKVAA